MSASVDKELESVKQIILKSGVLDEHDKNVGGDLYSPEGNQELTADALAQYIVPALKQELKQSLEAQAEKGYDYEGNFVTIEFVTMENIEAVFQDKGDNRE